MLDGDGVIDTEHVICRDGSHVLAVLRWDRDNDIPTVISHPRAHATGTVGLTWAMNLCAVQKIILL